MFLEYIQNKNTFSYLTHKQTILIKTNKLSKKPHLIENNYRKWQFYKVLNLALERWWAVELLETQES